MKNNWAYVVAGIVAVGVAVVSTKGWGGAAAGVLLWIMLWAVLALQEDGEL